ncbi:TetR/AcrR family transcriptional regulator C-terminal domain-containing protein [Microbacterium sp. VKM Ac-2870]|uniref:TetR/AcrR family transcriptional regulator C-terminal domain-containing protein n=1 Tax=Microbacterium sp. VKM Ac-2870 TaxID=2783825 RepID=UPI00188C3577|nr:TetR/AcrR family transcriptional regulator C-terminal domain-containing protein [Microbacterium sp. VKM Ac-2870]MBF4562226.1 TetR/AcrR family transcriptional regulator C-terminal domain-containing protein [Microbacterium sp. VKM Ac-2870]
MPIRGLSPDDVAATALRLVDEGGLPDFTMRRLAAALGVQPSAIYWHYPNKQTLLAELADRIIGSRRQSIPHDAWSARLREEAIALREALLAYRDGAEIVSSTMALGLGSDIATSRLVDALATGPFDSAATRHAAATVLHFILGHVSLEQQRMLYDSLGAREGAPVLLSDASGSEGFRFGIDTIIDGLEVRASEESSSASGVEKTQPITSEP